MRAQKSKRFLSKLRLGWHFVIIEKKPSGPMRGRAFGKETSQGWGSCIVSPAVMAAMGSILTNKYAEGLPGCGGFFYAVFFLCVLHELLWAALCRTQ